MRMGYGIGLQFLGDRVDRLSLSLSHMLAKPDKLTYPSGLCDASQSAFAWHFNESISFIFVPS
jgi:hypothetical protein